MLRKAESSSTQKIFSLFSSEPEKVLIVEPLLPPIEEEATTSWYDSISSSIGWLNPFKSSRPSLKRAAIQTLVIVQSIDAVAGKAICFSVGNNPIHHELSCADSALQNNAFLAITLGCDAQELTPGPKVCVETHEVKPSHHVFTRATEILGDCTHAFYEGFNNACVMQSMQDFFAPGNLVPTSSPVTFPNMTNTSTPSSSNDDQSSHLDFYLVGGAIVATLAVGSILLFRRCKRELNKATITATTEETPLLKSPADIADTAEFYEQLRARLDMLDDDDTDVVKLKAHFDKFYDEYKSVINETVMNHPVTLPCRHSDEQEKIQEWYDTQHDTNGNCTCPQCRDPFQQESIIENQMMRAAIVRKLRDFESKVNQLESTLKDEVRITIGSPGK